MNEIKNCCSFSQIRRLEVINICDGKKLGSVCDLEMDLCNGCILAFFVPKRWDWSEWFGKRERRLIRIPWSCIEQIGDDIILVRLLLP